jgi:hypothetical protein
MPLLALESCQYFEPADYLNYQRGANADEEGMGAAFPHFYKEAWDAEEARTAGNASVGSNLSDAGEARTSDPHIASGSPHGTATMRCTAGGPGSVAQATSASAGAPCESSINSAASGTVVDQDLGAGNRVLLGSMTKVSAKQCQMDLGRERVDVGGVSYLGKDFLLSLPSLLQNKYGAECALSLEPLLLQICCRTSWGGDLYLGVRAQVSQRLSTSTAL